MRRFERVPVRRRERQNAGLGAAVVRLGDGVELLLAGGVPQHQAHFFAVDPENTSSFESIRFGEFLAKAPGEKEHSPPEMAE
jgi:hypothetical protein